MEKWEQVEQYFNSHLLKKDAVLEEVLKENQAAGLPAIDVAPHEGELLHILAKLKGVSSILEIGTLGGYSTICLGRALPENGKLVTLEYSEKHAQVAEKNIARAKLENKIHIIVGKALDSLPTLEKNGFKNFDLIFIDADKKNNPHYLNWALDLAQPGAMVIIDNVVRHGEVVNAGSNDESVQGTREMVDLLATDSRIDSTAIQTVGSKGHDGFIIGIVNK
ncbi:O-methyltransferase [Evansella halocellulosilytica]|uniref:O-methyltransferase n=1 Tax=Evansella halocellulosilytica TaxID=2011013 RepID=UPI0027B95425|nr:O-methyltransferase [Evansella halocellulosilytica]